MAEHVAYVHCHTSSVSTCRILGHVNFCTHSCCFFGFIYPVRFQGQLPVELKAFLCVLAMCVCGCSPGILVSSQSPKTSIFRLKETLSGPKSESEWCVIVSSDTGASFVVYIHFLKTFILKMHKCQNTIRIVVM